MFDATTHYLLVAAAAGLLTFLFILSGIADWRIAARRYYPAIARQSIGQAIAGTFTFIGAVACVWLAWQCHDKTAECGTYLVPILIFDKYMTMFEKLVLWVAKNISFKRAGLRRMGPPAAALES